MSDAHDVHVLNDLAAAIRATPGAPEQAAAELAAFTHGLGAAGAGEGGRSVLDAAREALGSLTGHGRPAPVGIDEGGQTQRLAALMARLQTAMDDDRLSGSARDAVLRAFDPVKAARDAALQAQG